MTDKVLISVPILETETNSQNRSSWYGHPLVHAGLLLSVVLASQLGLFLSPQVGVYLSVGALAGLLAAAALSETQRKLYLAAAIIPLLSLINTALVQQSALEQTAILYSSMLILALIYRRIFAPTNTPVAKQLGRRGYLVGLPLMLIIGAAIGLLGYTLLITSYIFGGSQFWQVAVVAVIGALAEEQLFRGLIQRQATQLMRPIYAAAVTSLLYLTLCFSHFTGWSLLVGALSTVVLSSVYLLRPNLVLTTTLNAASKLAYLGLTAAYLIR